MKVYAITYYTGDADITIKVYKDKSKAEEHAQLLNLSQPATKHSGGPYYSLVEWEVE
jgi:hypothetical protein